MEESALPFQALNKRPASHKFSITRFTNPRIRRFLNGFRQFLRRYSGPDAAFNYQWVRVENGDVFLALAANRSVQDVFAHYLRCNNGDAYFAECFTTNYDGKCAALNAAFAQLFARKSQLPNSIGRSRS